MNRKSHSFRHWWLEICVWEYSLSSWNLHIPFIILAGKTYSTSYWNIFHITLYSYNMFLLFCNICIHSTYKYRYQGGKTAKIERAISEIVKIFTPTNGQFLYNKCKISSYFMYTHIDILKYHVWILLGEGGNCPQAPPYVRQWLWSFVISSMVFNMHDLEGAIYVSPIFPAEMLLFG